MDKTGNDCLGSVGNSHISCASPTRKDQGPVVEHSLWLGHSRGEWGTSKALPFTWTKVPVARGTLGARGLPVAKFAENVMRHCSNRTVKGGDVGFLMKLTVSLMCGVPTSSGSWSNKKHETFLVSPAPHVREKTDSGILKSDLDHTSANEKIGEKIKQEGLQLLASDG